MKSLKIVLACAVFSGIAMTAGAKEHLKSINPDYIDQSIPAGEDFYARVTKGWQ